MISGIEGPLPKSNCQQNIIEIPMYQENSLMETDPLILLKYEAYPIK